MAYTNTAPLFRGWPLPLKINAPTWHPVLLHSCPQACDSATQITCKHRHEYCFYSLLPPHSLDKHSLLWATTNPSWKKREGKNQANEQAVRRRKGIPQSPHLDGSVSERRGRGEILACKWSEDKGLWLSQLGGRGGGGISGSPV